jgi:transposase
MLIFTRSLRVCLAIEPCDLRASFEKLAIHVRERLGEDERSSQVFVFGNRRRDRVKLLYWDGTGLWIMSKRLEAGTFSWPRAIDEKQKKLPLRAEALEMLLSGIDLKGARLRPWYEDNRSQEASQG